MVMSLKSDETITNIPYSGVIVKYSRYNELQ